MKRLGIGSHFPKISLTDIGNKSINIVDGINTKYCILLFFRGVWWPKCTLQLEGYRKYRVLFEKLGASIIAASVDSIDDTKRLAAGNCFPKREKEFGFTLCHSVTREISDTLGAYWEENNNFMQPAEFVINCNLNKIISCTYSDGGLGRMNAGDAIGFLSGIEKKRDEFPHIWSWWFNKKN